MKTKNRRGFIKDSLFCTGGVFLLSNGCKLNFQNKVNESEKAGSKDSVLSNKIKITESKSLFEKESLLHPFGFKGGYLSELWQVASYLKDESGNHSIGLGTQSVLWSDPAIFSTRSETEGNSLMYALTERALQILVDSTFISPLELIDHLYSEVYEYGKLITKNEFLRKTFALNALVSVDNALWLLFAKKNKINNFDEMIPQEYFSIFSERHDKLAAIPLISYNVSPSEIKREVDLGYFFMKIKIGQPGTQNEMLEKDMKRLYQIHSVLREVQTPFTENGKIPYYFDANGRYETKETFHKLLDYAYKINAFDQIVVIEEPFPEEKEIDVSDIPIRLASDESAHTDTDTLERIQMGYKAIALKPIAKTLSMTMKIAKAATDNNIPCFCADLTVNPILVEWNKNISARLKSFPGLENLGLIESNGHQNYMNWELMKEYFPKHKSSWVDAKNGFYEISEEFYKHGGGIFDPIVHYEELFKS